MPLVVDEDGLVPGYGDTRRAWPRGAGRPRPGFASLSPREVFLERVKRAVPLGREQLPEDIGRLAAFLASDAARNITGQWIAVDGGITLRASR